MIFKISDDRLFDAGIWYAGIAYEMIIAIISEFSNNETYL